MVTVSCVFVRGRAGYKPEYVYRLRAMVFHNLAREHRFVVLTDQPHLFPGLEAIRIPSTPIYERAWWSKVNLFSPLLPKGRQLYIDLDSLISQELGPIVDYPAQLALIPHAGNWDDQGALKVVKRFNSSVMVWDAEAEQPKRIYDHFYPLVMERLWGDQDWIGEVCFDAATMPLEWFPRLSEITTPGRFDIPSEAKVVLCKKPKNAEAEKRWPEFSRLWRSQAA